MLFANFVQFRKSDSTHALLLQFSTVFGNRRKDDPVADCIEAARLASVPIVKTDKHQLNEMAGQRPHQVTPSLFSLVFIVGIFFR